MFNSLDVSIIIPVHNGEEYIEKCLNSITAQTYRNLEIIVIDDGSTDNSYAICEQLKETEPRLRLFKQPQKGVSAARNHGLKKVRGKYVMFVDCDDWIAHNYVETLVSCFNNVEADLVACEVCRVYSDRTEVCSIDKSYIGLINSEKAIESTLDYKGMEGYLCNKAFRSEIISKYNLVLDESVSICEDLKFVIMYLNVSNNAFLIDSALYYYLQHDSSARAQSIKSNSFNVKWLSEIDAFGDIVEILKDNRRLYEYACGRKAYSCGFYLKRMIRCRYDNKKVERDLLSFLRRNIIFIYKYSVGNWRGRLSSLLCCIDPHFAAHL